jgi:hypothetical protein
MIKIAGHSHVYLGCHPVQYQSKDRHHILESARPRVSVNGNSNTLLRLILGTTCERFRLRNRSKYPISRIIHNEDTRQRHHAHPPIPRGFPQIIILLLVTSTPTHLIKTATCRSLPLNPSQVRLIRASHCLRCSTRAGGQYLGR